MVRVYLFRGKHPLYETLISHPPEGVEYFPRKEGGKVEEYSLYGQAHSTIRKALDDVFEFAGVPRYIPFVTGCDLVHSSRGFIPIGAKPYVVDIEHISSFVGMRHPRLKSAMTRKMIERALSSSRCCAVLPHCEAAERTISLVTRAREVLAKSRVIYPSVDPALYRTPRRDSELPRILFMGEYLWKGGREVIETCAELAKTFDFTLKYISLRVHPSEGVVRTARQRMRIEYVQGPIPRRELIEDVYPNTDIFVMPTYIDTFGYAYLEAMACGIPCVGTKHFAVPEIIEHEVTGLIVEPPLTYFDPSGLGHPELDPASVDTSRTVLELREALGRLLESKGLRERYGHNGRHAVSEGKYSIPRRNAALREVYETCLSR